MTAHAAKVSNGQLALIHVLAKKTGMDDETYRDFLNQQTGTNSAANLSFSKAGDFIETLRARAGDARPAGAVAGLDGPVAKKIRALWIAAYHLGVVHDRTDRAMLSYLERQTGVSHTRFLKSPRDATQAIEGLKAWLERAGNVAWPADTTDIIANKRAVINAQWMRLVEIGAVTPLKADAPLEDLDYFAFRAVNLNGWMFFEPAHYDQVHVALGRKVRDALAKADAEAR